MPDIDWRRKNPERARIIERRYSKKLRRGALEKLGGICVHCGFDDKRALQIDHINGGGIKEYKNRSQHGYYREIIRGERGDLQLLCANCNWIKRANNKEHS